MAASAIVLALVGAVGTATSVFAGAGKGVEPEGSSLEAWGADTTNQLGDGMGVRAESRTPVPVSGITCAVAAAVNGTDSFAVLSNGTVEGWGADEGNKHGFLGDNGSNSPVTAKPVRIDESGITSAVGVAADNEDVYVLLANGTIVGWGNDSSGQFGNGSDPSGGSNTPVAIATSVSGVSALAASDLGATLALLSDGEVDDGAKPPGTRWGARQRRYPGSRGHRSENTAHRRDGGERGRELQPGVGRGRGEGMGEGTNGQLGNGKTEASKLPVTVGGLSPLEGVSEIAAGSNFALVLVHGEVKAWGDGAHGQLGNGEEKESEMPVPVAHLTNIIAIAATEEDGYALDSSGRVWAWGSNKQGELGTGISKSTADEPVEISLLGSGNTGLAGGVDGTHEIRSGRRALPAAARPNPRKPKPLRPTRAAARPRHPLRHRQRQQPPQLPRPRQGPQPNWC